MSTSDRPTTSLSNHPLYRLKFKITRRTKAIARVLLGRLKYIGEIEMLVEKNVQVGKETADVFAAMVVVLKDIKAGKTVMEIGANALPALINAVAGVDQLPEELKDRKVALVTVALGVSDIMDALSI